MLSSEYAARFSGATRRLCATYEHVIGVVWTASMLLLTMYTVSVHGVIRYHVK